MTGLRPCKQNLAPAIPIGWGFSNSETRALTACDNRDHYVNSRRRRRQRIVAAVVIAVLLVAPGRYQQPREQPNRARGSIELLGPHTRSA
jgi:hypothetical protein